MPENAPKEFLDRFTLWNSVELNEKAINAQLARNFIIALPKELSLEENKDLINALSMQTSSKQTERFMRSGKAKPFYSKTASETPIKRKSTSIKEQKDGLKN